MAQADYCAWNVRADVLGQRCAAPGVCVCVCRAPHAPAHPPLHRRPGAGHSYLLTYFYRDRPLDFRYADLGEMLSLGSDAASISALKGLVTLRGPLASAGRRAVYAARMPTAKQAAKVGLSWAVDAAFDAARRVVDGSGAPPRPPPPR